eukprot:TRINITY_DN16054_c0_g1_i5.p1 TRINITY_DN16054_c0_g1~~TRINITY_DN16054_c0_g1_i5.p1  ORF type:complete len:122 (-),score=6.06 TRINITY_DN16054_c0_g1_i5:779-1144(-)
MFNCQYIHRVTHLSLKKNPEKLHGKIIAPPSKIHRASFETLAFHCKTSLIPRQSSPHHGKTPKKPEKNHSCLQSLSPETLTCLPLLLVRPDEIGATLGEVTKRLDSVAAHKFLVHGFEEVR